MDTCAGCNSQGKYDELSECIKCGALFHGEECLVEGEHHRSCLAEAALKEATAATASINSALSDATDACLKETDVTKLVNCLRTIPLGELTEALVNLRDDRLSHDQSAWAFAYNTFVEQGGKENLLGLPGDVDVAPADVFLQTGKAVYPARLYRAWREISGSHKTYLAASWRPDPFRAHDAYREMLANNRYNDEDVRQFTDFVDAWIDFGPTPATSTTAETERPERITERRSAGVLDRPASGVSSARVHETGRWETLPALLSGGDTEELSFVVTSKPASVNKDDIYHKGLDGKGLTITELVDRVQDSDNHAIAKKGKKGKLFNNVRGFVGIGIGNTADVTLFWTSPLPKGQLIKPVKKELRHSWGRTNQQVPLVAYGFAWVEMSQKLYLIAARFSQEIKEDELLDSEGTEEAWSRRRARQNALLLYNDALTYQQWLASDEIKGRCLADVGVFNSVVAQNQQLITDGLLNPHRMSILHYLMYLDNSRRLLESGVPDAATRYTEELVDYFRTDSERLTVSRVAVSSNWYKRLVQNQLIDLWVPPEFYSATTTGFEVVGLKLFSGGDQQSRGTFLVPKKFTECALMPQLMSLSLTVRNRITDLMLCQQQFSPDTQGLPLAASLATLELAVIPPRKNLLRVITVPPLAYAPNLSQVIFERCALEPETLFSLAGKNVSLLKLKNCRIPSNLKSRWSTTQLSEFLEQVSHADGPPIAAIVVDDDFSADAGTLVELAERLGDTFTKMSVELPKSDADAVRQSQYADKFEVYESERATTRKPPAKKKKGKKRKKKTARQQQQQQQPSPLVPSPPPQRRAEEEDAVAEFESTGRTAEYVLVVNRAQGGRTLVELQSLRFGVTKFSTTGTGGISRVFYAGGCRGGGDQLHQNGALRSLGANVQFLGTADAMRAQGNAADERLGMFYEATEYDWTQVSESSTRLEATFLSEYPRDGSNEPREIPLVVSIQHQDSSVYLQTRTIRLSDAGIERALATTQTNYADRMDRLGNHVLLGPFQGEGDLPIAEDRQLDPALYLTVQLGDPELNAVVAFSPEITGIFLVMAAPERPDPFGMQKALDLVSAIDIEVIYGRPRTFVADIDNAFLWTRALHEGANVRRESALAMQGAWCDEVYTSWSPALLLAAVEDEAAFYGDNDVSLTPGNVAYKREEDGYSTIGVSKKAENIQPLTDSPAWDAVITAANAEQQPFAPELARLQELRGASASARYFYTKRLRRDVNPLRAIRLEHTAASPVPSAYFAFFPADYRVRFTSPDSMWRDLRGRGRRVESLSYNAVVMVDGQTITLPLCLLEQTHQQYNDRLLPCVLEATTTYSATMKAVGVIFLLYVRTFAGRIGREKAPRAHEKFSRFQDGDVPENMDIGDQMTFSTFQGIMDTAEGLLSLMEMPELNLEQFYSKLYASLAFRSDNQPQLKLFYFVGICLEELWRYDGLGAGPAKEVVNGIVEVYSEMMQFLSKRVPEVTHDPTQFPRAQPNSSPLILEEEEEEEEGGAMDEGDDDDIQILGGGGSGNEGQRLDGVISDLAEW